MKALHPEATPAEIADKVMIGAEYKTILLWMREDLKNYAINFESLFEAKLTWIERLQHLKSSDLAARVNRLKTILNHNSDDVLIHNEIIRV